MADGLAVVEPHAISVRLLRQVLDETLLVAEDELVRAVLSLLEHTHNLAEGAGAAALAGALRLRDRLQGRKVGIILSGGNLDVRTLTAILSGPGRASPD